MNEQKRDELAERGSNYAAAMLGVVLDAFPQTGDARPERLEELYTLARRLIIEQPDPVAYVAVLHLALAAGGVIGPTFDLPDDLTS